MQHQMMNPTTPGKAFMGSGIQISSAAIDPDNSTAALAIKRILARVAVSEPVALVIARHAGLIREAR
jgi:hypothetical protein